MGADERNPGFVHKCAEHPCRKFSVSSGANQQEWAFCELDHVHSLTHCFFFSYWSSCPACRNRTDFRIFSGDIFGKFRVSRARSFLLGDTEGFTYSGRNITSADDLMGEFGDREHHFNHVQYLEFALFTVGDRLLSGDHHQRHGCQLGVGCGCHQIGCTRTQG